MVCNQTCKTHLMLRNAQLKLFFFLQVNQSYQSAGEHNPSIQAIYKRNTHTNVLVIQEQTSEYHSPKFSSLLLVRPKPVSFFTSFFLAPGNSVTQHQKQTREQTVRQRQSNRSEITMNVNT